MKMHNAPLGGKLGLMAWALGIDYGPLGVPGGRGTAFEGRMTTVGNRHLTTGPVYRMIADLGMEVTKTATAGGVSGHVGSRMYTIEVHNWRHCHFKDAEV